MRLRDDKDVGLSPRRQKIFAIWKVLIRSAQRQGVAVIAYVVTKGLLADAIADIQDELVRHGPVGGTAFAPPPQALTTK